MIADKWPVKQYVGQRPSFETSVEIAIILTKITI